MALARDFKDTVAARVQNDPAFAQALLDEAITLFVNGEPVSDAVALGQPNHEQYFGGLRSCQTRAQGRGAAGIVLVRSDPALRPEPAA